MILSSASISCNFCKVDARKHTHKGTCIPAFEVAPRICRRMPEAMAGSNSQNINLAEATQYTKVASLGHRTVFRLFAVRGSKAWAECQDGFPPNSIRNLLRILGVKLLTVAWAVVAAVVAVDVGPSWDPFAAVVEAASGLHWPYCPLYEHVHQDAFDWDQLHFAAAVVHLQNKLRSWENGCYTSPLMHTPDMRQ